jgi:hypothetical protein
MVASGALDIERIEDGIPIFIRGRGMNNTGHVNRVASSALQETNGESLQQTHLQQTPLQVAQANARLAKMAHKRSTRIAQEKTKEAAQEVERIEQEVTAESRKAKKAERYRVTTEKLGKLPPCPKLCRGGECDRIPCKEEEPGFPYSHINDMVVCHDKWHMSMATRDGNYLFHLWPARKRSTKPPAPATNSGGGTSGARHVPPSNNSKQRKTGKPRNANSTGNGTQRQQQQQQQQQRHQQP